MAPTYAVTGASGRLGGRIARRLAAAGLPQTLLVRNPARAPELPGATAVSASYDDPDAVVRALRPTDVVLMVSASETPDRVQQHRTFIDAALSYDFGAKNSAWDGVMLQVNAKNLFDEQKPICSAGYCYKDEGRSVFGSLRYRF